MLCVMFICVNILYIFLYNDKFPLRRTFYDNKKIYINFPSNSVKHEELDTTVTQQHNS